jgi:hypothetical protein
MDYTNVRVSKDPSYQALLYKEDRITDVANIAGDIESRRREKLGEDYDNCQICTKPLDEGETYIECTRGHVYHDACAPFLAKCQKCHSELTS